LTARARLAREAVVVLAAVALLAAVAYSVQRYFFSRPVFSPYIPRSLDDALRPVMLRQIRAAGREIADPAVKGAFAAIADRLRPAFLRLSPGAPPVTVIVVDSPVINAFTLPGGVVCVCSGLARTLVSGEEMAAILGHELSHVANRDPLALLARRIGISALADIVTAGQGGTVSQGIMQELVNARYTRRAEDRADLFAVDLLFAAGLPPASFAAALARIRDAAPKNPKLLQYFDPHSPVEQRIRRAGERTKGESVRARALDVDWSAVVAALSKEKGASD
jgi:predicted Zn-dependent protease